MRHQIQHRLAVPRHGHDLALLDRAGERIQIASCFLQADRLHGADNTTGTEPPQQTPKCEKGPPCGEPFLQILDPTAYFSEAQKRWMRLQASSSLALDVA